MPTHRKVVTASQLRDIEIAFAGVNDSEITVELTLDCPHIGDLVELSDSEATLIAAVSIKRLKPVQRESRSSSVIGTGEVPMMPKTFWLTGIIRRLQGLGHVDRPDLRATVRARAVTSAVVITGDAPAEDDRRWEMISHSSVVTVLDHGDSRGLAQRIKRVEEQGMTPVVLPAPTREGRSASEWHEIVMFAAQSLVAGSIAIWDTPLLTSGGDVILFTGLSGSGKSTISKLLVQRLSQDADRSVTLLDGDEVRLELSAGLGFTPTDRISNVRRIGWVAALVAKHGGVAICAPIAPYEIMRTEMRTRVEGVGRFLLVHISTTLEVCESRDRKGLYARARAGSVPAFTGISDPYEIPTDADVVIDAGIIQAEEAVDKIIDALWQRDPSLTKKRS